MKKWVEQNFSILETKKSHLYVRRAFWKMLIVIVDIHRYGEWNRNKYKFTQIVTKSNFICSRSICLKIVVTLRTNKTKPSRAKFSLEILNKIKVLGIFGYEKDWVELCSFDGYVLLCSDLYIVIPFVPQLTCSIGIACSQTLLSLVSPPAFHTVALLSMWAMLMFH